MTIINRLPEIVYPLTQVNKVNEIVDVLNEAINSSYTEENPTLIPTEGTCTWVVTHNLGTENVTCTIYEGDNLVISKVSITSENSVSVSLNSSSTITAGTYKIVVMAQGSVGSSGGGDITVDSTLSSTSTNPVQNKVITNALSGKADVDLSNLSINGQKVIDGSWVHSVLELSPEGTSLPVSNKITYNLNELNYLPNDGLDYEISVDGSVKVDSSQTGSGASTLSVMSSGSNGMTSWICRTSNTQAGESAGNVYLYITNDHILRVDSWGANKGTFRLVLRGYKRLGTNQ